MDMIFQGLIDERVPGVAAVVDDIVEDLKIGLTTNSGA